MARIDATEAERAAFKRQLEPLLAADMRKFDVVEWTVFFEALRDIPLQLLQGAVMAIARQPRRFPFRPSDIREAAEACRVEIIRANPAPLCDACRGLNGWIKVTDEAGVKRLAKCSCLVAWRERLELLGVTKEPVYIALPPASESGADL